MSNDYWAALSDYGRQMSSQIPSNKIWSTNSPDHWTTPRRDHSSTGASPGCDRSRSSTSTRTGPGFDSASTLPATWNHWTHSTATEDPAIRSPPIGPLGASTTAAAAATGCYFLEEIDFVGECFSLHVRIIPKEKVKRKKKRQKNYDYLLVLSTMDVRLHILFVTGSKKWTLMRHTYISRTRLVAKFWSKLTSKCTLNENTTRRLHGTIGDQHLFAQF